MIDSLNRFERLHGSKLISEHTQINTDNPVLKGFLPAPGRGQGGSYSAVDFIEGIPQAVIDRVNSAFGSVYEEHPEGYVIVLEDSIAVYANGIRGMVYAACDIARMARDGQVPQGIVYNRPLAPLRSLKLYLPPEENIDAFRQVIDLCCHYRCNTLIVEVGGAMEYKRHPEINEGWVAYCKEMHEYSGKTIQIQEHTFPWGKNSIHCENGGGKFLSQAQVRELVDYCRARGIEVIPEMPTLSHCDYLLTRHPEFAERQDDPWPDTYCPNHPGVYDYVLDVLDEVLEVFRPKAMHIGHDEYYSVAVCDRCRGKDGAALYADDILRIHGFLASRGVRTIVWSEKLLNAVTKGGRPAGGAEKPFWFGGKQVMTIPATYPAIERLPKDILCMHWYWSIVEDWDKEFLRRGFGMFYGNLNPLAMTNAASRLAAGALGGGPSNWSYAMFPYLQENEALISLAYAALLFWKDGMEDGVYPDALRFCFDDLYRLRYREELRGRHALVTHTTAHHRPYVHHADGVFIDEQADTIGSYRVELDDGSGFAVPVVYGQNISNRDRSWSRFRPQPGQMIDEDGNDLADYDSYIHDPLLTCVAYSTLPVELDGHTWYRIVIGCPAGRRIASVTPVERQGMEGKLLVREIKIVE